jgi:anhydro-N-acetylmuramic acid kinase
MSGTSMDGVDAALVEFNNNQPRLITSHEEPIPSGLLTKLHQLADPLTGDINLLGECDRACGELFARAVLNLLAVAKVSADDIIAIGSHGQTVRHMPNAEHPFTIQIGDANVIAARTDIDTVADFRRKDIALGGQGAPLVPAFHQQLFSSHSVDRVILNIGGIANITWLPANANEVKGFDTGPGNTLLDYWYSEHNELTFDHNGDWGRQGKHSPELLEKMLQHPYFTQAAPKSTGRELFNQQWLTNHLNNFTELSPQDIQATLAQLTVESVAREIEQLSTEAEIYLCGGGIFNLDLVARLTKRLPTNAIHSTARLGLAPQWVEAIAFAWLAYCHIHRQPANLPQVTGASRLAVLGSFFPAI